jgi:hypothetical protein
MNKKELKRFKEILLQRKKELIQTAEVTRERGMVLDTDDLRTRWISPLPRPSNR